MVSRLAILALGTTLAGVILTSETIAALGGALSLATIVAWGIQERPHNHWRGFKRHRF